jgi:hypothetical protein
VSLALFDGASRMKVYALLAGGGGSPVIGSATIKGMVCAGGTIEKLVTRVSAVIGVEDESAEGDR